MSNLIKLDSVNTLERTLGQYTNRFQSLIPAVAARYMTPDRLLKLMVLAATTDRSILNCTLESILQCMMVSAQLALEPGSTMQHLHLVRFGDKLQPLTGYRGQIVLATRTGRYSRIEGREFYTGENKPENLQVEYGFNPVFRHIPIIDPKQRGEIAGAYALTKRLDSEGGEFRVTILTNPDIDAIASKSQSRNSANSPWTIFPASMKIKSTMKRHFNQESIDPLSDLAKSITMDNLVEEHGADADLSRAGLEVDPPSSHGKPRGISSLSKTMSERAGTAKPAAPEIEPKDAEFTESPEEAGEESDEASMVASIPAGDLGGHIRAHLTEMKVSISKHEQALSLLTSKKVAKFTDIPKSEEATRFARLALGTLIDVHKIYDRAIKANMVSDTPDPVVNFINAATNGEAQTISGLIQNPPLIARCLSYEANEEGSDTLPLEG